MRLAYYQQRKIPDHCGQIAATVAKGTVNDLMNNSEQQLGFENPDGPKLRHWPFVDYMGCTGI